MELDISIIVPIKNEANNIRTLANELTQAMSEHSWIWECIWVDDGSTDDSLIILEELAKEDRRRHRFLSFAQNTGQSAALWAGFKESRGEYLATLDGDGQNDPADIPRLLSILKEKKADMINGYRQERKDNPVRKTVSKIANGFRNWLTGRCAKDVGCSTRVFKKDCLSSIPSFSGMHRFLPTLIALQGARIIEVSVNHRPRRAGKTKYTINNRLWVGLADTSGVFWLQKRSFRYSIKKKS